MSWLDHIDERDARRLALTLRDQASARRDDVADQLASLARHTRHAVEPQLRHAGDIVRREAPVIAEAALRQAKRAARSAKADPVPVVVGVVGLLLVASLLLGRRRT
jgi:hypothetical protein